MVSWLDLGVPHGITKPHFFCHNDGGKLSIPFKDLKEELSFTWNWGDTNPVSRLSTRAMSLECIADWPSKVEAKPGPRLPKNELLFKVLSLVPCATMQLLRPTLEKGEFMAVGADFVRSIGLWWFILMREKLADVLCVYFVSVLVLGCLIVVHVLMAVTYPLSNVFSRVFHEFIHSHMGNKCIQIGI